MHVPSPIPIYSEAEYIEKVTAFYKENYSDFQTDLAQRLQFVCESLLGKPYVLGALGEGPQGEFDQSPLYRLDAFDCFTFVNTVLALGLAQNVEEFTHYMALLNYYDKNISYHSRFHFMSPDWNVQNAEHGIIEDITREITDQNRMSVSREVTTLIDRPRWFLFRNENDLKLLSPPTPELVRAKLEALRNKGTDFPALESTIDFIPKSALFDEQENPQDFLFSQIPNATIIEIVSLHRPLREKIGTDLQISHLGFVFWQNNELLFYHAALNGHVTSLPLIAYLKKRLHDHAVDGIQLQKIIEK